MAMRLRVNGDGTWQALCAAKSTPLPGDVYLDDRQDHAIREKLYADWRHEEGRAGDGLAEWQELYYYLFGTVRNEIRTGGDAITRLDHIWVTLRKSREKHLKLERKYDEAGTD